MSFFGYRRPPTITLATTTAPAAQEHLPPYAGKIHTHAVPTYGSGQGYGTHERHRAVCLVCGVELVWYGVEFCGEFGAALRPLRRPDGERVRGGDVSDELPAFSGDRPKCVKCGWTHIHAHARTRYMTYGHCIHEADASVGWEENERLHRECARCGYQWDEALAEADP